MFTIIDKSARLRGNTLEVFGVVPKSKSNLLDEDVLYLQTPFGSVNTTFFKNRRGVVMYRAWRIISGNTTIFELKGWASAVRYSMKQFYRN